MLSDYSLFLYAESMHCTVYQICRCFSLSWLVTPVSCNGFMEFIRVGRGDLCPGIISVSLLVVYSVALLVCFYTSSIDWGRLCEVLSVEYCSISSGSLVHRSIVSVADNPSCLIVKVSLL